MEKQQIVDYIDNCYREHGPFGDRSLEYIGLIIKEGLFEGIKEYRRLSRGTDERELASDHSENSLFSEIVRYAKIYDFSRRLAPDGREYTRIVFAPYKSILLSEELFAELMTKCGLSSRKAVITGLMEYYDKIGFTGQSPLLKMGLEFSPDRELIETKLYFALRSYDDRNDSVGRRFRYEECRPIVKKSLELLGMASCDEEFHEISIRMEELGYYPVFTGINFSDTYAEMKVYYETCLPDYSGDNVLEAENALCSLMMNDAGWWKELNRSYIDRDLFLDCVSYSVIGYQSKDEVSISGGIWKPYYLVGSDDLRKNRQIDRYDFDREEQAVMDPEDYRCVLLVDEKDTPVGIMSKAEAHRTGRLHRAFSVFLYDENGNMLLQKRAAGKYHSPGLWTNACCSHPLTDRIGEEAEIRLKEELGISCRDLEEIFTFSYKAYVGNGLTENETDHVFIGQFSGETVPNPEETEEVCAVSLSDLRKSIKEDPERYTAWFLLAADRVIDHLMEKRGSGFENN